MVAVIAGCITFLLGVVHDMDNPFDGEWVISYTPFTNVASRIKTLR